MEHFNDIPSRHFCAVTNPLLWRKFKREYSKDTDTPLHWKQWTEEDVTYWMDTHGIQEEEYAKEEVDRGLFPLSS